MMGVDSDEGVVYISSVSTSSGSSCISGDNAILADTADTFADTTDTIELKQKNEKEMRKMNIYNVVIVDRKKPFTIYNDVVVVASSRETASLKAHCDIPDDAEIEVIIREIGSFEPVAE